MEEVINILFLDIDGVLYPCRNRKSFKLDPIKIRKQLKEEKHLDFHEINDSTLLSVYEGFTKEAIMYLQNLTNNHIKIVISSNWKFRYTLSTLKKLFLIHDIEIYDVIPNSYGILKQTYIQTYLTKHPEITNYVIVDDVYMHTFQHHFVKCDDTLNKNVYLKILKKFQIKC